MKQSHQAGREGPLAHSAQMCDGFGTHRGQDAASFITQIVSSSLVEFYPVILHIKMVSHPCWATLATLGSALGVAAPQVFSSCALNSSDRQNRGTDILKPRLTPRVPFGDRQEAFGREQPFPVPSPDTS